jgi:hypothetical protein
MTTSRALRHVRWGLPLLILGVLPLAAGGLHASAAPQQHAASHGVVAPAALLAGPIRTGVYRADDGGTYYVRVIGDQVWWAGESADGGRNFTNVFHGTVIGSTGIYGDWADVPKGRNAHAGKLRLEINSPTSFTATAKTGGFGGSHWTAR